MARYPNGRIPDHELITFKTGWNSAEGTWKHQLTPGAYAKHLKLVALAKKRKGRTLTIGDGWGAYRPLYSQEYARKVYGMGAAVPGTSSHGGNWLDGSRGWRESMATDYDNWGWVYDWDRNAFYEDVRAAGLVPGLIHPSRGNGYPDEPWHVVDLDPWAPAGSPASPSTPEEEDEEDDMKNSCVFYETAKNTWVYLVFNTGSGWYHEYSNGPGAGLIDGGYNNGLAGTLGTGSYAKITAGHARVIKESLDAVRRTAVTGSLSVDISDQPQ